MPKKKKAAPKKLQTNVRVSAYVLTEARKFAEKKNEKISDYFNEALHDANAKFARKFRSA